MSRDGCRETWDVATVDGRHFCHNINCTWVFDQGGPVLGYRDFHAMGVPMGPMGIANIYEREAALQLGEIVGPYLKPDSLGVRWFANGSDACDAAIRVARAATGSNWFISVGYHGSSVVFAHAPQCAGVPVECTASRHDVDFGDLKGLASAYASIGPAVLAAIMVEVPSTDNAAWEFLGECRRLCDEAGALLILDEVVTGFRIALGGAAELYGIAPDLACYGKALANGRPISALVGPRDEMAALADRVFYSNTYNGDPFHCALALMTMRELKGSAERVYPHLWYIGAELKRELNAIGVPVVGHAPRTALNISDEGRRREFCWRMIEKGIMIDRPNYASMAHADKHVRWTWQAAAEVLEEMGGLA
uniref:Putative aminotransferase n=1 Tax=viral metagenome TaxID=1070528 RepID=A0A6M3L6Z8_9ZZZZ